MKSFDIIKSGRNKYGFKVYLLRRINYYINRILYSFGKEKLSSALKQVGLERGATVCVHSALSRMGYIKGGASTVIDSILESVGPTGNVMMPSFPMRGSMLEFIERKETFDVIKTPSRVGVITEEFRKRPEVKRSLHPTNSVAVWGQNAYDLIRDHERSLTPYGKNTPYGYLAAMDDSFILMMETHIHSLLHHLQERVEFPNLYLPDIKNAEVSDEKGRKFTVKTKVMRPKIPYWVAVPSAKRQIPDWAILHDYALIFPSNRKKTISEKGFKFDGYPLIYKREEDFKQKGILSSTKLGKGHIGLLHVRKFLSYIEPELKELIDIYRDYYVPEYIKALELKFF